MSAPFHDLLIWLPIIMIVAVFACITSVMIDKFERVVPTVLLFVLLLALSMWAIVEYLVRVIFKGNA
jgi:hypothetical protein